MSSDIPGIRARIADVVEKAICGNMDWSYRKVADLIVEELGLIQFDCDGERWWATHIYSTGEIIEIGGL